MRGMFSYARSFNGDISNWDVSKVTDMQGMFDWATSFNVDISNWDVSRVINMNAMFYYARSFSVDISSWDVSRGTNMNLMFVGATSFKHTIWAPGVWGKITRKHCVDTIGSAFSTLTAAKAFCLKQGPSACSGVYDDSCDGKGSFYACRVGDFAPSNIGSCIYVVAEKDEFIRAKNCALCCMLTCMCTRFDTRTRVSLSI